MKKARYSDSSDLLRFNGHCKDRRIVQALTLLEASQSNTDDSVLATVILSKYSTDNPKVRKYAKAILRAKAVNSNRVVIG